MLHNFTGNLQSSLSNKGNNPVDQLYPSLNTSYYRMIKLFINKCGNEISTYSSCIDNSDWKNDINQFIPREKRVECWKQWSSMKGCSNKHLGKMFTLKMESNRQIQNLNTEDETNQRVLDQYNSLLSNKFLFMKEDLPGSAGESDE